MLKNRQNAKMEIAKKNKKYDISRDCLQGLPTIQIIIVVKIILFSLTVTVSSPSRPCSFESHPYFVPLVF